jgi:hypothetical protein
LVAFQSRDVTPQDSPHDVYSRCWLAELQLDARARQEPPVGLDQRAARGQIDNVGCPARPQTSPSHFAAAQG